MSKKLKNIVDNISPERKRRFQYAEQIGAYLDHVLNQKELNQKELAQKMDMKPAQLNRYMNGEANLNLETIARIGLALNKQIISIKKAPNQGNTRTITVEVEEQNLESDEQAFKLYRLQGGSSKTGSKPTSKNISASSSSQLNVKANSYA